MCVLKHSTWMNPLALRPENALIRYHFFIHTRIIHPVGRPFATSLGVLRGPRFHFFAPCFAVLSSTSHFVCDQFFKLFWTNSMLSSKLCFFNTFTYVCFFHLSLRKTKNPRVFNPRVLEVCCVNLCVTRQSSGPLKSLVYDHMIDFRH
jgi:hypothetical protein